MRDCNAGGGKNVKLQHGRAGEYEIVTWMRMSVMRAMRVKSVENKDELMMREIRKSNGPPPMHKQQCNGERALNIEAAEILNTGA